MREGSPHAIQTTPRLLSRILKVGTLSQVGAVVGQTPSLFPPSPHCPSFLTAAAEHCSMGLISLGFYHTRGKKGDPCHANLAWPPQTPCHNLGEDPAWQWGSLPPPPVPSAAKCQARQPQATATGCNCQEAAGGGRVPPQPSNLGEAHTAQGFPPAIADSHQLARRQEQGRGAALAEVCKSAPKPLASANAGRLQPPPTPQQRANVCSVHPCSNFYSTLN